MVGLLNSIMRISLWLLFAAATALGLFWLWLVVASGFEVWRESNAAGLSMQVTLLLYPVGLFAALKSSSASFTGTVATFLVGWTLASTALLFLIVR